MGSCWSAQIATPIVDWSGTECEIGVCVCVCVFVLKLFISPERINRFSSGKAYSLHLAGKERYPDRFEFLLIFFCFIT